MSSDWQEIRRDWFEIWHTLRAIIGHQLVCWAHSILPEDTTSDIAEKYKLSEYIMLCGKHAREQRSKRMRKSKAI
jgi:hypothetical protein